LDPQGIAIAPTRPRSPRFGVVPARHGSFKALYASASKGITSPIVRYFWRFGNGTFASTNSTTIGHMYTSAGTYTVILTVTDSAGTSTTQVFTGKTMSRNGGPSAQAKQNVTIS
jgi:hypothetical protein